MNAEDFRFTWVLSRQAWYIRLYLWVWEASAEDITFCKLWWGYLLIWFGFPCRLVVGVCRTIGRIRRIARSERRRTGSAVETPAPLVPKAKIVQTTVARPVVGRQVGFEVYNGRWAGAWSLVGAFGTMEGVVGSRLLILMPDAAGEYTLRTRVYDDGSQTYRSIERKLRVYAQPAPLLRALEDVGDGFTRLNMLRASVASVPAVRSSTRVARRGVLYLSALVAAGGAIAILYVVATTAHTWAPEAWRTASNPGTVGVLVVVSIIVGALAVAVGLGFALVRLGILRAFDQVLLRPAVKGTKSGALGFREMMKIGYHSVKSNTCPRVVVEDEDQC